MELMAKGLTFVVVALCAVTMGFAIQRGATCTVAAVEEVVARRGAGRLIALVEASAWVAGGLLIAHRLHWLAQVPMGYAVTGWTFAGAALLGIGAFVTRACVFGAIARLGSGEWAYAATPLGFYLGCVSVTSVFAPTAAQGLGSSPVFLAAPAATAWLIAGWLVWRIATPLVGHRGMLRDLLGRRLWSPHAATIVIGLAFLVMLILAGAWAYTDVLADLANGMVHDVAARMVLLMCLLAGAIVGGWTAGRLHFTRVRAATLVRCLIGGVLMGWGSLLIPGGNDGLILVGMPMLWPYAWVAFATMCLTIGSAQWVQLQLAKRRLPGS
ncbi:MAG: YeeE/YedE thiosulfate transporter family protein [Burkholderiales bacterium]